jgi:hypothetical protein
MHIDKTIIPKVGQTELVHLLGGIHTISCHQTEGIVIIVEQRPPVKPVLPPMPPMKPIQKPYPPMQKPYHPPYQPPYHPPKYEHRHHAVPCDPKMLHHMYRHMKMCHRYETQMLRMYMKWCKEQWKHRHHRRRPYNPCDPCGESSSYRRESSSHHHHDGGCGC